MDTNDILCIDMARLLDESYRYWSGKSLASQIPSLPERYKWIHWDAPFGLLAHGEGSNPYFIYGNIAAQACFEYSWNELLKTPSRLSAPSAYLPERERFLQDVKRSGIAYGYSGVRVKKSGNVFHIHNGTVWELRNVEGKILGQAAQFWLEDVSSVLHPCKQSTIPAEN